MHSISAVHGKKKNPQEDRNMTLMQNQQRPINHHHRGDNHNSAEPKRFRETTHEQTEQINQYTDAKHPISHNVPQLYKKIPQDCIVFISMEVPVRYQYFEHEIVGRNRCTDRENQLTLMVDRLTSRKTQ